MLEEGNKRFWTEDRKFTSGRVLVLITLILIFFASILIVVTFFSENARAEYGLQITVHEPKDKYMNASTNPQSTNFTIEIENKGTLVENVNITVTFDDPSKPAEGWTVNPNNFTVNSIGPGVIETRQVIVTAPVDEPYPSFAQLTVLGWVQENTSQTSQDNFIARISRILDVTISPIEPSSLNGDPGESISFLFEVKNNGSSSDSYNIKVDSISTTTGGDTGIWFSEISFDPTNILNSPKGAITPVTMYVDIPFPSDLSLIPPGIYNITVEVSSMNDSNVKDTLSFSVNVQRYYWADIEDTVIPKTVDVGASVQYNIVIKNKGNDLDYLSVEIEGDPAITGSQNWGKLSHSGTGQMNQQALIDIDLDAGSSTIIVLEITIPNRTDPGYPPFDPDDVTLKVIVKPSEEDGIDDYTYVTADINTIYEFDFDFLAEKLEVQPGEVAEFTLKIDNRGTSSETFSCEIFQWEEDWSAYGYSFWPSPTTIAADTIGEVYLSITTPSDLDIAISRDYNITVKIHSSAGNTDVFKNCTIHIEPVYDVDLTISESMNKSVDVGDTVTYQFTVRNTGNIFETFLFDVYDNDTSSAGGGDQSNWARIYLASAPSTPVTSVDLDFGQVESMILEITVPNQGDPNFVVLYDPLEILVEVISEQEPGVTDSFSTYTTVNPIYSFELTTTAPMNKKYGEPGETVSFTLLIRNTGTATDSYNFIVTSLDETIFTLPNPSSISNLDVDYYGQTYAQVTITAEKDKALVGTYSIQITATSLGDTTVSNVITLYVEITTSADVDLTPSSQTDSGEPGDVIDYIIRITNMGNNQDAFDLSLEGTYKQWGEIFDNSGTTLISQVTLTATGTPGYFTDIILRVTIPGTGETIASQTYTITMKASSTNIEGVHENALVATTVEEYVEVDLEYSGSGSPIKDYDPNRQLPSFTFRVYNHGNMDETGIEIMVEDIGPGWDYSPKVITDTLEPGMTTTFSLFFDIPSDEDLGSYQLQVYIISSMDFTVKSSNVTTTINITKPDLSISTSDVSGLSDIDFLKGKVGNAITVTARVYNLGNSDAENIQVKFYEDNEVRGTKAISSIEAGGFYDVNFRWTVVAEEVEIKLEITPLIEIDEENNAISPISLDLRPDLDFSGDKIIFSKSEPEPNEDITITAYISNIGGDAEDVVVKFYEGTKIIGTDTLDIDFGETGEAIISWKVSNKPGESVIIMAEIDHSGAIGDGSITSKSIYIAEEEIEEPQLELVGNLVATEGKTFSYTITIENYDPQKNYTFTDNTELFTIDPNTGNITFIPSKNDVGTHVVTITVSDDEGNTDTATVTFRILEAEEETEEPFNFLWIVLIVIAAIVMFFVGYLFRGKGKVKTIPSEMQQSELPPPPPPYP